MAKRKKADPRIQALWTLYKEEGDETARDELITSHLHLVKYVVGRMAVTLPSHIKVEDMYSTGIVGLIKAVEKYDLTKKNKFETYAILLIKGAIIDEMRALDWVPRSVHQKANMISKAQEELQEKFGREPSDAELAKHLKMSVGELEELMLRVRPAILIPLNSEANDDADGTTFAEKIPDLKAKTSFENADHNEFRRLLEEAVLGLPEQERTVLVLYYYENLMLKEIGQILGVSESRISQVHAKAILRLRKRLKDFVEEFASIL